MPTLPPVPGDPDSPPAPGDDCYSCHNSGTLTVAGKLSRFHGAVYAQKKLTYAYKLCDPPTYKDSPGRNLTLTPSEKYCSDGHLVWGQTTTDCSGNYSITLSGSILGLCLLPGDWIVNPSWSPCASGSAGNWLIPNPASVWDYSCGWSTDLALSGTGASLGFANGSITDVSEAITISGGLGGTVEITPCDLNRYTYRAIGCQSAEGVWAAEGLGYESVSDPSHPGQNCPRHLVYNGSYGLDITYSQPAFVKVFAYKNGFYYNLSGVNLTVTDSCGHSVTVTSGSSGFYGGSARLDNMDWTLISGVTINSGVPTGCDPALWPSSGAQSSTGSLAQIRPHLDDLHPICTSYRAPSTGLGPVFAVILDEIVCDDAPAIRLQADVFEQILAVSWVGTGNTLKTAVHLAPLAQIGASADGWLGVTTLESANANDIGMVFLPNGRLYLTYDLSGAKKYRISQKIGTGTASDWSASATPSPSVSRHSASGRGEEQSWRFRALSVGSPGHTASGNIEFSQCRDNRGDEWTAPVTVATAARGVYCGGAFLGNAYGLLWKRDADSILYWKTSGDATTWAAGNGTATSLSGIPVGMARTDSSVLVGLLWDATSKRCRACRSGDRGLNWEQDTADIMAIPALDTPPVLVALAYAVFAVYTLGDQPLFACSVDAGRTWK